MGEELAGSPGRAALRVGIVGAGFIGTVHARAARRQGARVVAVAASSPSSGEAAVERLGAEHGCANGDELIERDDIDVVHICTPNDLHVPLARAAIERGKHVVCEKPLAIDVAGADALCAAGAEAGVVATVPFVYRFYPMVREARARVRDGFGRVHLVHGAYLQDWLSTPGDQNWRVDAAASGPSRAFADIGSHWCDLVEFVTGDRIAALSAELVTVYDERAASPSSHSFSSPDDADGPMAPVSTEDAALVTFRLAGGGHGSLVVSQVSSGRKNQLRFELSGNATTIAFDQEHPDELWLGGRSASQIVSRDPASVSPAAAAYITVPPGHPQGYQDCFDAFVGDTYRAITAGSTDKVDGLPTFSDGRRAAQITAAVLQSAASHQWVDLASREDQS